MDLELNPPQIPGTTSEYLEAFLIDSNVTIIGKPSNSKAGALVVADSGGSAYIKGLSAWDDDTFGKQVRVTGILRLKKIVPDPQVDERGAISASMEGITKAIEGACWILIDP
jgi:hypothetical protein